jgi:hypothetical protein
MIFSSDLSEWAREASKHRKSEAGINAFARTWNQGPQNKRFAAVLGAVVEPGAEKVAEAIRHLFKETAWVDAFLRAIAREMRRDPFFVPPFRHLNSDVHQGLIVYEDDKATIAVGVSAAAQLAVKKGGRRSGASIQFSGQVGLFKFVKAGGARLSFWEAPTIGLEFSRATAGQCRKTGERDIEDGEILTVDGRFQTFVIEAARSNILLLQATVKPDQAPLSVEYDSESHEFVGCSAADDSASRIQMIASLLRKLDCSEAFPVLADFLDNPNFYVRWHVMRELLGLDATAALPLLERMADHDLHADNRKAARSVLASLQLRKAA